MAVTVALEDEVNNGGFGQYFTNEDVQAGEQAVSAYRSLGRTDLAEVVASAVEVARAMEESDRLGDASFAALDAKFWRLLEDDPTSVRADFVRRQVNEL